MPDKSRFGLIGLAVMGRNLALNIEEKGFPISVYNRKTEKTRDFLAQNPGKRILGIEGLEEFVKSIEPPRPVLLMIKAGPAVDLVIDQLAPLLDRGDIVIDGGNSWFKDTMRRQRELEEKGLHFVGLGVSGGEEGARFGPSMMPGGSRESYERMRPVLEAVAAKTDSGPCVTHVGPDGAGHFVKMVHNGIEYGDMQLIAEAYDLMRKGMGMKAKRIADVFAKWNEGPLESFLIEITADVLRVQDDKTGAALVDMVLDKAGQKGTGKWTAQVALDLGVPAPTIAMSLFGRMMSGLKEERAAAAQALRGAGGSFAGDKEDMIAALHEAVFAAKVCSYAQGMNIIRAGSELYGWDVDLRETARVWKAGCIIRARFLDSIMKAYEKDPALPNLLLAGEFKSKMVSAEALWRRVVATAQALGVPAPAMSASLAYFDSYRSESLPQNLTQAQRDAFGAHTYQRVDDPEGAFVHTDWLALARKK